jgi:hypothetical protein
MRTADLEDQMPSDELVATVTVDPENFGDGVLTLASPALSSDAIPGQYRVNCIAQGRWRERFRVITPQHYDGGSAFVDQPCVGPVRFTIERGAIPFAIGDNFFINVQRRAAANDERGR